MSVYYFYVNSDFGVLEVFRAILMAQLYFKNNKLFKYDRKYFIC